MSRNPPRIAIAGAGLCGGLLANFLGRAGYHVELYERRADPRIAGASGGRSINLALSARGLRALEEVGLSQIVLATAVPMRGRLIHDRDGGTHFQPYDKDPARYINSVSRAGLNTTLLDALRPLANVRVRFDCRCVGVDFKSPSLEIEVAGRQVERVSCDAIIAADGAFSAVRGAMEKLERFDYQQFYIDHGYKELHIPPRGDGGSAMPAEALHIWPRRSFMMIALPNADRSFTCTCFWPFEGPASFASLRDPAAVRDFFVKNFPDAVPLMPTLTEDFERNPVGSMITVRCGPWHVDGKILLIGDAAHSVVPFYGQGMNAAFEDCSVLAASLRDHRGDLSAAFADFYARRKGNVDTLADLALENFIEMRDKTASPAFRAYKRTERVLSRALPSWFVPLYTLVSFTTTPYADAVRKARRQNTIVFVAALALSMLLVGLMLRFVAGVRWVESVGLAAMLGSLIATLAAARRARKSGSG